MIHASGAVSVSTEMKAVLIGFFILCGASAEETLQLSINEKCQNETEPWICKKLSSCPGLKQGDKMEICSSSSEDPIVCCPPNSEIASNSSQSVTGNGKMISDKAESNSSSPIAGAKAEEIIFIPECREYAKYVVQHIPSPILLPGSKKTKNNECPISAETLIVGGTQAKLNEFPHMASIGIEKNGLMEWFCGGSLISPRFILSAAHCNISEKIGRVVARLGDLNLKDDRDRAKPINVRIVEAFDHPKYDHSKAYHDISLLKMERDIQLGPKIRPLCLHTKRRVNREKAIASGWGRTSYGGKISDYLLKVTLKLAKDKKCIHGYRFDRELLPKGVIPDIMFCAGSEQGDMNTCQGDSGGPLQIPILTNCMYSLIGITSFGDVCGKDTLGGYTRVSHYVPWIETIVWP